MGDPSPLLTAIYPAMMGIALIAVSALGCRMRGYHRQLVGLEMRVGALETMPMLRSVAAAPAPMPVYQMPPPQPPQPSAPPMMDPIPPPPTHVAIGMPTVAAVTQMQRYTGYI